MGEGGESSSCAQLALLLFFAECVPGGAHSLQSRCMQQCVVTHDTCLLLWWCSRLLLVLLVNAFLLLIKGRVCLSMRVW